MLTPKHVLYQDHLVNYSQLFFKKFIYFWIFFLGIGKTTSARLILKELGYQIVEQNASDIRNKKNLHNHLGGLTTNKAIKFEVDDRKKTKMDNNRKIGKLGYDKVAVIMDEVDGMSSGGN